MRFPAKAAWAAAAVLALGLAANVNQLDSAGREGRELADHVRTTYGATEIAADTVAPGYHPAGFFYPEAGSYLAAARDFGSLGYSAAELQTRSAATRLVADRTLLEALRLEAVAVPASGSGGQAPQVAVPIQGAARASDGCLSLRRGPTSGGAGPQPLLAEITLPPGGVSIAAERLGGVAITVGRFADRPALPVQLPPAGQVANLVIPRDGVAVPWRMIVRSRQPVAVCGLG
jgi:hypothetical protein